MVFALETQHGKLHDFGVRLEEMLIVTDDGPRADHLLPDRRDHGRRLIAMSAVPIALDDPAALDPAVVGVKAARLAAAADAGLPVLPGSVFPLEASAAAIAGGARVLERSGPPGAYLAVMGAEVPEGFAVAPSGDRSSVDRASGERWVARSSTIYDDDGRWSGTFGSYLDIEAGDVPTAVRGCWASAFSRDALGRCAETAIDVETLRIGVLVQPFLSFDAGGTARIRPDGGIDVAVAPGGPTGVVGGRSGGRDVRVEADGTIADEQELGGIAATVVAVAGLARRAAASIGATVIEWGAVGGDISLLQVGPAGRPEARSVEPRTRLSGAGAPIPAEAERLARLVTAFPGPLADVLVLPWALGARDETSWSEVALKDGVSDPATAIAEARALAADATVQVWGMPPPESRERAANVARLLLQGRVTDAMRMIAGLRSPDPAAAARVVGLVRIVGERLTAAGVLPSPLLIWRLTVEELDRAIAGTPPALRSGPGRWEPFVAEVVRARGRGTRAAAVSPGIGSGRLHLLRDLRSIGRPGPRSVLAAALPLPHLAPLLWHSAALVTTGGTSGAHLFEVARSLGVPAVIGAGSRRVGRGWLARRGRRRHRARVGPVGSRGGRVGRDARRWTGAAGDGLRRTHTMALVAVTDHVFPDLEQERRLLLEAGHELRFGSNAASIEEVRDAVAGAEAVLNCYAQMPAEVIRGLDRCVVIARYGIGLDTVDLDQATAQGILVTNVPDYCIDEVSDHALALILSLARGVTLLDRKVRAGSWTPTDARPLHRLRGRTLGLVGFGRIARALAAKMTALGFRVVTTDPFVPEDAIREAGAEPLSLEELLAAADVVSIHAPLTADSRHLIGAAELARHAPGRDPRQHVTGSVGRPRRAPHRPLGGSAGRGRARCPRGGAAVARGPVAASGRRDRSRRTRPSTARSRSGSSSARPSSR